MSNNLKLDTGGAVDLTLGDAEGNPLPMGTEFDEFYPGARTRFLEKCQKLGSTMMPPTHSI